jgi:hypothetical protein
MELTVERDLSSRWRNKGSSCECLDKVCQLCVEKSGLNYWTDTTTSLACPSTPGRAGPGWAGTRRTPGVAPGRRRGGGSNGRRGSRRRWRRGVPVGRPPRRRRRAPFARSSGDRSPDRREVGPNGPGAWCGLDRWTRAPGRSPCAGHGRVENPTGPRGTAPPSPPR